MLHQVIRRTYYLNKHLEAPLLKEREEYLEYLASKGYYRETLKITAEYLLRITEYLHLEPSTLKPACLWTNTANRSTRVRFEESSTG